MLSKLVSTLGSPGELQKFLMPGVTPKYWDLIGLECILGFRIFFKTSPLSQGGFNVQTSLEITAIGYID